MRLLEMGSRGRIALVSAGVLAAMGCDSAVSNHGGQTLVTAPSSLMRRTDATVGGDTSSTLGSAAAIFTLTNGKFWFAGQQGELRGTYTGVVSAPINGSSTVQMSLQVTGGTGALANASGTLEGVGHGTFAGEGRFTLSIDGVVLGEKFQATLVGAAGLGCTAAGQVISRLRGEGTVATGGRVDMRLESQVVEGFCS